MELTTYIENLLLSLDSITDERKEQLDPLLKYLRRKKENQETIHLNFVCTHNSRRSQLSQVWGQTAADYFKVNCIAYSSGVEVTAFNERAVKALEKVGFKIVRGNGENPIYELDNGIGINPSKCFSKLINHDDNPKEKFAAVMTCSHADENCPVIFGMEERIALNYEDPGKFDGTAMEEAKYEERSEQIAREMYYLFKNL